MKTVKEILNKAESFKDKGVTIHAAELVLLRNIAGRSADLIQRQSGDFKEYVEGDIQLLKDYHKASVDAWVKWIDDNNKHPYYMGTASISESCPKWKKIIILIGKVFKRK